MDGELHAATTPGAVDEFENQFGASRLFSRAGAAGIASSIALVAVAAWLSDSSRLRDVWILGVAVVVWAVVFAWVIVSAALVRWLARRHTWPNAMRRMIAICVFIGVPLALILIAKNLTAAS